MSNRAWSSDNQSLAESKLFVGMTTAHAVPIVLVVVNSMTMTH
jgi:hypothetical protein